MSTLLLPDAGTLADLVTYLGRAQRVDPGGAVRLVARERVLAAYVSPVHGGGGPTVIGLRVVPLADAGDGAGDGATALDATVPLAAMADRFARLSGSLAFAVPPAQAPDATWAGMSPPRSGWQVVGAIARDLLVDAARHGVEEVAAGVPEGAGSAAVARLRALVWGRDLPGVERVPAGAAYAAESLGFVGADEPVALYAAGPWRRLTTSRGHVLTRAPLFG